MEEAAHYNIHKHYMTYQERNYLLSLYFPFPILFAL